MTIHVTAEASDQLVVAATFLESQKMYVGIWLPRAGTVHESAGFPQK